MSQHSIIAINQQRLTKMKDSLLMALAQVEPLFPLSATLFDQVGNEQSLMFLDAFRVRFCDLQDYIGNHLFKLITVTDQDEDASKPLSTRQRIVLMEKRRLLTHEGWSLMREIRNNFTHDYPDEIQEKIENLNAAWRISQDLIAVANKFTQYLSSITNT